MGKIWLRFLNPLPSRSTFLNIIINDKYNIILLTIYYLLEKNIECTKYYSH